jgi:hypothetical protein
MLVGAGDWSVVVGADVGFRLNGEGRVSCLLLSLYSVVLLAILSLLWIECSCVDGPGD